MSSVPSTSVPQRPLEPPLSLDERIRRAELRLIAREDNLKRRLDLLGRQVQDALQPRRYIMPAIGVGVALFALLKLWRGRARPHAAPAERTPTDDAPAYAVGSDVPWMHLLALAWPLLPAPWRARISPGTAATLVSMGLPLAERLLTSHHHRPLPTAEGVDLARFAGTWHEIARLPQAFDAPCEDQPSAHYTLHGDRLELVQRCAARSGRTQVRRGTARVVPDSGNAKLQVTMLPLWLCWLPFAWLDQWVLYVDEGYHVALLGHPNRRHLHLLSRSREMRPEQLAALMQFATELEFPVAQLRVWQPPG